MNSNSKSRRFQERKRTRSENWNKEDKKRASLAFLMKWFLITGGKGSSILPYVMQEEMQASKVEEVEEPPTDVQYSKGIVFIGRSNFLSAAVTFCHDVAREGRMTIVSVGSGDGSIEKKILEMYRERYGQYSFGPNIILVDPDPRFKVHFKYVDELIEKRPDVVGHCALFIFWPDPQPRNDGYDIEAIRKLQPHGVLTVYESGGGSGSREFVNFLRGGNELLKLPWRELGVWNHQNIAFDITEGCESHGLDNYEIEEVAVHKKYVGEFSGTVAYRMAIARRMDFQFVNLCPTINWTCKQEELKFRRFIFMQKEKASYYEGLELISDEDTSAYTMLFNMESLGLTRK